MPHKYYHRGRGRGHGRGQPREGPTTAPTGHTQTPRRAYAHPGAEIDVVIQQWVEPDASAVASGSGNGIRNGHGNRGGRGWRGGTPQSRSRAGTPLRGSGMDSPRRGDATSRRGWARGRGRGRGRGGGGGPGGGVWERDIFAPPRRPHFGSGTKARHITKDGSLSDLLYAARPLLRPVKFVRATLTPFLFQNSEEMLKSAPDILDTTETSQVPTADRVARLFRENASQSSDSEDSAQDELDEVDFADMAHLRAEIDAMALDTVKMDHNTQEGIEEVDFADLAAIRARVDAAGTRAPSRDVILEEVFTGVYSHIKDTVQATTLTDEPLSLEPSIHTSNQTHHASISRTRDTDTFEPSIDISSQSHHESIQQTLDAIIIEDKLPCAPNAPAEEPTAHPIVDDRAPPPDTPHPLFVIDTTPTFHPPHRTASDVILVDRTGHGTALGDQDQEDEYIVYVAPHPRSGRASPVPASDPIHTYDVPRVKLPRTSILTGVPIAPAVPSRDDDADHVPRRAEVGVDDALELAALRLDPDPVATVAPKGAVNTRKKRAQRLRTQQRQSKRGVRLREVDGERRQPRWETRRRGDSDLDWGTDDDSDEDAVDAVSNGIEEMQIDPDLHLDANAMQGFLKSMSVEGSRFVTIDDIEDQVRIQQEDEEDQGELEEGSDEEESDDDEEDDEEEAVFNVEEKILLGESEDDVQASDSDDDALSPRSNFEARLRRIRAQGRHSRPRHAQSMSDDEDGLEDVPLWTRSANDDAFIAHIEDMLEQNSQILTGRDRKQKKALLRGALADGQDVVDAFLDDPTFTTPVAKKKKQAKQTKGTRFEGEFAAELEAQWAKDRAKKATVKQAREKARLIAALDTPKGKDKGAPDPRALEAQVRRFVEDVRAGTRSRMALPPMSKGTRKLVHELAAVFGVKSVSKGKDDTGGRYTTLMGTKHTGVGVREDKVRRVMKRYGRVGGGKKVGGEGRVKGGPRQRQKEGEEVGKEAPKIGENNVGFKMLASMGWSEGDRIGGTGSVGIEAPLTAIIKHSKLGLGATR